jgi:hypothetical protein
MMITTAVHVEMVGVEAVLDRASGQWDSDNPFLASYLNYHYPFDEYPIDGLYYLPDRVMTVAKRAAKLEGGKVVRIEEEDGTPPDPDAVP